MPKLSCNARSCMHNSQDCCCLGEIKVSGDQACHCDETCCSNFYEDIGNTKDMIEQSPTEYMNVMCQANNCMHNKDCICQAAAIDVSGYGAIQSDETCCSSFEIKE